MPLLLVAVLALLLALAALLPRAARAEAREAADPLADVVAEAFFLADPLPPGGHELNLIVAGGPDAHGTLDLLPAVELGLRPDPRVGLVVGAAVEPDSGVRRYGDYQSPLHSPAASLRVLLRSPEGGALGVATCLDVLGPGPGHEVEATGGLGLIRAVGAVTLRAAASVTTSVTNWGPRLHAGLSAAVGIGRRWRLLGEAIVETAGGETAAWGGPSAKVELRPDVALAAGALLDLRDPAQPPRLIAQLTVGL